MRKTKFRAMRRDTKQWFYWNAFDLNRKTIEALVWTDEETTSQYTGLKDKNGKEIYEGDIVKNEDEEIYDIKFEFNSFNGRYMVDEWELEVIGNIYSNPDLLK